MVLSSTLKCNHHSVGYQLHDQRGNSQIQKENRMTIPYLAFPSLSLTFRSEGYINTSLFGKEEDVVVPLHVLTINVITKDRKEVESVYPIVYLCPLDFELNNWSIVKIPIAHKLSK